jgi:3-oxoacyl-[acyl-carrier protein] reductase
MPYAWVTGGSRGIGRATAIALARAGYDIALTYAHRADAAAAVVAEIQALGRTGRCVQLDLSQPASGRTLADATLADLLKTTGCPDVLVHNAGLTHDGLFAMASQAHWDATLGCNLDSFYTVVRPVVRQMLRRRGGRIVTIASLSGQRGNAGQVAYSASKAGLIGATKALALEVASRGIAVNAVAPGLIETDMTAAVDVDAARALIPMGRLGTPEDVAELVCFLCSPAAAYITGQVVGVNGGLHT